MFFKAGRYNICMLNSEMKWHCWRGDLGTKTQDKAGGEVLDGLVSLMIKSGWFHLMDMIQ
jgi:hypothetical protein